MRNPVQPLRGTPISGSNTPKPNSVFDNFGSSVEASTYAIYGIIGRIHTLADQARGPMPSDDNNATEAAAPSLEGKLVSLDRAVGLLNEALSRLDNG